MFRDFYAEQKMTDPRDNWYKPNLLYNIHYRPQKPPTPPKMMVVTKEFNQSVCTCSEHSCGPQYRMEREVVWSNKEMKTEEGERIKQKIFDHREVMQKTKYDDKSEEDDNIDDDSADNDQNDEVLEFNTSSEKNVDNIKGKVNGMNDQNVRTIGVFLTTGKHCEDGFEAYIETQRDHLRQKRDDTVQGISELEQRNNVLMSKMVGQERKQNDSDNMREFEEARHVINHVEIGIRNELKNDEQMKQEEIQKNDMLRCEFSQSSSDNSQYDDNTGAGSNSSREEINEKKFGKNMNDADIEENSHTSLLKFDDLAKPETSDIDISDVKEPPINHNGNIEEYGSAFGIMRVYCESELHISWDRKNEFHGH
ncbi:surface protein P113-like [Mercenaria mercenaria]|uniref:surface protein P113-like n=1 Tax=Mercenaria mercenaria TaxID=6596 RepID=UPI00234E7E33|nr:surface protein P113-like [Mercenaria mercenaria]